MQFQLRLSLPHEAASVPVVRAVTRRALEAQGVDPACVDDVELAVSEACTNVVDHAGGTPYTVVVKIDNSTCYMEIIDHGPGTGGFGRVARLRGEPPHERGRGIPLMRALVDHLDFEVRGQGEGTTVHMEKTLRLVRPEAVAGRSGGRGPIS